MEEEGSGEVFNTEIVMVNSWNEKANISQLCRICANSSDCLISIFEGEGIQHELSLKINKHLPLKVTLEDKLPKNVCYPCASTLIAWHDMSISCIEADKKLHSLICDGSPAVSEDEFCDANSLDFEDQNDSVDIVEEKVVPEPPPPAEEADELEIVDVSVIQKMASSTSSHVSKIDDKTVSNELFTLEEEKVDDLKVSVEPEPENVNSIKACEPSTSSNNTEHTTTENVKSAENKNPEEFHISFKTLQKPRAVIKMDIRRDKLQSSKIKRAIDGVINTAVKDLPSNKFKCDICNNTFTFLSVYKNHMLHHKKSEKIIKNSSDNGNLKINSRSKSVVASVPYNCSVCGKIFKLKDSFRAHLRTHSGEKSFICHLCGKQFCHPAGLKYHLKHVHLKIKNYSCDICGRSFAMKSYMEDHRRIHTGERPFICDVCGKGFKTKASLYIHCKIHTDLFPFTCDICYRKFRWRQQLQGHFTTHTGEKNHICNVCGKQFRVKNQMTRHKLIHNNDKPYSCSVCSVSFGQKRYLKNHMKTKHKSKDCGNFCNELKAKEII